MIPRRVESFRVGSDLVAQSPECRLDATFYNGAVIEGLAALEKTGMELTTVGDLTERVFIPNRFKRNYVDSAHGVPFLRGSHIIHFRPDDMKYLSKTTHTNMGGLLVRKGWILITRSGTVGRVALVTSQWDGWAATEDLFRVVPKAGCPVGYLAAFLDSPLGQLQLSRQVFGAVIDHLTEDHIRSVRVPMPANKDQREWVAGIDKDARAAADARATAVAMADSVDTTLAMVLPSVDLPPTQDDSSEFSNFEDLASKLFKVPKSELQG